MLPKIWPAVLALGWILLVIAAGEGAMALFSLGVGDGYADDFMISATVTTLCGGAFILTTQGRPFQLQFRDAAILTAVTWFAVPAFAAMPLIAEPAGLSLVDAYFEAVSGLTATGATVIAGLDELPPTILLWRATMQWIGGVGIIGLAILILPFLKVGGMQLYRLEFSDRSEKAMPRMRSIATAVVEIYLLLTLACFAAYWLLGMTAFDALSHAFATVSTGGFSTHDLSFATFDSAALQWTAVVFMIAGALPFLAYLRLLRPGSWRQRLEPQIPAFLGFLLLVSVGFAAWLVLVHGLEIFEALTLSTFNVVSIVTTTGFVSVDYLAWGAFAAVLSFLLMFVGGCSGSTSGGVKILRYQILFGIIRQHIRKSIYPHAVSPIRFGERIVTDDEALSVGTFIFVYFAAFMAIAIALGMVGLDAAAALSAAATAIGNVGPGATPEIGPVGTFAGLPDSAKLILSFAMIMGRLEVLGLLLLVMPSFYR